MKRPGGVNCTCWFSDSKVHLLLCLTNLMTSSSSIVPPPSSSKTSKIQLRDEKYQVIVESIFCLLLVTWLFPGGPISSCSWWQEQTPQSPSCHSCHRQTPLDAWWFLWQLVHDIGNWFVDDQMNENDDNLKRRSAMKDPSSPRNSAEFSRNCFFVIWKKY